MHSVTLLWLPIVALAVLAFVGAAPAAFLGSRMPADARAALALPLGAAVFACGSALLILDVPIKIAVVVVLAASLAIMVALRKHLAGLAGSAKIPLAVAGASLLIVSVPFIRMGSWEAATYGDGDPYLWVSQAKAYLDGPAPATVTSHPDRAAYNRYSAEHWPVALPFGVAAVGWLSGEDPAYSYSAFVVLLAVLLTSTVYVVGRAVLEWSKRKAAAGALIVIASAYMLFATNFGWQAQMALTTFALASLACFRLTLDRPASRREQVLTGLFAAAAIATYGSLLMAFIPLYAFVLAGFAFRHRAEISAKGVARAVAGSVVAAMLFGCVAIVSTVLSISALAGKLSDPEWDHWAHGLVPAALGLVPQANILAKPLLAATIAGTIVALAIVTVLVRLFANGSVALLARRHDFLLSGTACIVAMMLVMLYPGFSPYWSIKVGGYGAPILVLTAFAILTAPRSKHWAARRLVSYTWIAATLLFVTASGAEIEQSVVSLEGSRVYAGLAAQLANAGPDVRVEIDVKDRDPWRQLWAIYYLRDTPISVTRLTGYLTGYGAESKPTTAFKATYRLAPGREHGAVWYGDGLALRPIRP